MPEACAERKVSCDEEEEVREDRSRCPWTLVRSLRRSNHLDCDNVAEDVEPSVQYGLGNDILLAQHIGVYEEPSRGFAAGRTSVDHHSDRNVRIGASHRRSCGLRVGANDGKDADHRSRSSDCSTDGPADGYGYPSIPDLRKLGAVG